MEIGIMEYCLVVIILLALSLNIFAFYLIKKKPSLKVSSNRYIRHQIVVGIVVTFTIALTITIQLSLPSSPFVEYISSAVFTFAQIVSLHSSLSISIDTYIVIRKPLTFSESITRRKSDFLLAGIYFNGIFFFIFHLSAAFVQYPSPLSLATSLDIRVESVCLQFDTFNSKMYFLIYVSLLFLMGFIIPLFVFLYMYCVICHEAQAIVKRNKNRAIYTVPFETTSKSEPHYRARNPKLARIKNTYFRSSQFGSQKKSFTTGSMIISHFLSFTIPYFLNIFWVVVEQILFSETCSSLPKYLRFFTITTFFFHTICVAYIHVFRSKEVKKEMFKFILLFLLKVFFRKEVIRKLFMDLEIFPTHKHLNMYNRFVPEPPTCGIEIDDNKPVCMTKHAPNQEERYDSNEVASGEDSKETEFMQVIVEVHGSGPSTSADDGHSGQMNDVRSTRNGFDYNRNIRKLQRMEAIEMADEISLDGDVIASTNVCTEESKM